MIIAKIEPKKLTPVFLYQKIDKKSIAGKKRRPGREK
jgi:hypothetical protein